MRSALLDGRRPYFLLLGLTLLLYLPTLTYQLIYLDDNLYFQKDLSYLLDWRNVPEVFRRGSFLGPAAIDYYYRPLLILSFMVNAHLGGSDLAVYHLANILYHAASAVLVWRILRKDGCGDAALLLACVFAAHPALANAVGWINGCTDSLLAVFLFASLHAYQYCLEEGRRRWIAAHWLLLVLALLTKELAVVLPAACALYAWLAAKPRLPLSRHAVISSGWLAALFSWWLARRTFLHTEGGYTIYGMLASVSHNLPALPVYWGKLLLPAGLSPYPILADASLVWGGTAAAAAAALAAVSWSRESRGGLLWGLAGFVMFLLPSFVYPARAIVPVFFEYRLYVPMLCGLYFLAQTKPFKAFDLEREQHAAAAGIVLAILALGTWNASAYYRDGIAAWSRAVAVSPSSAFAHKQLGVVLMLSGDARGAEGEFLAALARNTAEPMAHNNLGVLYMRAGLLDKAEREYQEELRVDPGYADAWANLGLMYEASGRTAQARQAWQRALELEPSRADAQQHLALLPGP